MLGWGGEAGGGEGEEGEDGGGVHGCGWMRGRREGLSGVWELGLCTEC